eukprot:1514315-Prymnesium_polylepis.1
MQCRAALRDCDHLAAPNPQLPCRQTLERAALTCDRVIVVFAECDTPANARLVAMDGDNVCVRKEHHRHETDIMQ